MVKQSLHGHKINMDMQEHLSLYETGALSLVITHNKSPCA